MKRIFSAAAFLSSFYGIAEASDYPPGYVISNRCQSRDYIEVCALNRDFGSFPRLSIRYQGQLLERSWGRISAFVKLNSKSGIFKMSNSNFSERLMIGSIEYDRCFVRDSNNPSAQPPRRDYRWCKDAGVPGGGGLVWEITRGVDPADQDVLFYARSDRGLPNAWDIEVSFLDESGRWDSLDGQNYRFRFE